MDVKPSTEANLSYPQFYLPSLLKVRFLDESKHNGHLYSGRRRMAIVTFLRLYVYKGPLCYDSPRNCTFTHFLLLLLVIHWIVLYNEYGVNQ